MKLSETANTEDSEEIFERVLRVVDRNEVKNLSHTQHKELHKYRRHNVSGFDRIRVLPFDFSRVFVLPYFVLDLPCAGVVYNACAFFCSF